MVLATGIADKIGYDKFRGIYNPITWPEFLENLPIYLLIGIFVYIFVYYYLRNKPTNSTRFCIDCEKTYRDNRIKVCDCGGEIHYLGDYKFIDDEKH